MSANFPAIPQVPLVDPTTGLMAVQWQGWFTTLTQALNQSGGTNPPPPPTPESILSQAYQGPWISTTTYFPGFDVSYNGNVFRALLESLNVTPVNGTYWLLVGPLTMDWIANGGTYAKMLAAGLTSGVTNTTGIVTNAVTNYAITVDAAGGTFSSPYTTTTIDHDMESVSNTTTGLAVEVDVAGYVGVSQSSGMALSVGSFFSVYRDGAFVGTVKFPYMGSAVTLVNEFISFSIVDTPAAGSHTYTFHAHLLSTGGSGTDTTVLSWTTASIKMREFKR